MSVSLSRSTSFCSHSSSPTCSPSPLRIQSPSSSTSRKANIPRSTANSPLPFLVTKSDKFVLLGSRSKADARESASTVDDDDMLSSMVGSSASESASASATAATAATPMRRSHRGAEDAIRVAKRKQAIVPNTDAFLQDAARASTTSTPKTSNSSSLEGVSPTWTRRRGRTAEANCYDSSSSASEQEEDEVRSTELSPSLVEGYRDGFPGTVDTCKASVNLQYALVTSNDGLPSPSFPQKHRVKAAFISSAHGLERNFETKVSMTPPARMLRNYDESPFTTAMAQVHPATDARKISIPRSSAFGPFAPLPLEASNTQQMKDSRKAMVLQGRASALGIEGLPDYMADEVGDSLDFLRGVGKESGRHVRSRTEGAQKQNGDLVNDMQALQQPRRRAATTLRSTHPLIDMEVDDLMENDDDAPPPSPSPAGELSFPQRFTSSGGESNTDSDGEGLVLRPGARPTPCRTGSSRSISTSHCPTDFPSLVGSGGEIPVRSLTTSSLKTHSASQSSLSTSNSSKISTQGMSSQQYKSPPASSPYKTPNKRRARMTSSSSAMKNRAQSTASPVAAPIQSEEGSLFGSNVGGDMPSDILQSRHKRRSTGSFLPSTPSAAARLFADPSSPVASLASPNGTKGSSLPPSSPETTSQRKLLHKLEMTHTPNAFAFDDSGVAFTSPLTTMNPEKLTERALGKHFGITSISHHSTTESPSKAALARRTVSEQHHPSPQHHFNALHPFSVRERSALANETRMSDCGGSSAASSPEVVHRGGRVGSISSFPEGLASPVRSVAARRTSLSASSLAVDEKMQAPYLTPQNYKNVVPLQTAFMSTGLASKRSRPSLTHLDLVTGETLPPLPAKLNYTLGAQHTPAVGSTAQVGLRDVMAAATASSAAVNKPSAMPDTPVKRPLFPSFTKALPQEMNRNKTRPLTSRPSMLSPPPVMQVDGNESSSSGGSAYGGDSPLLNQTGDSPTLGLSSVSAKNPWAREHRQKDDSKPLSESANEHLPQSVSPSKGASYCISPEINLQYDPNDDAPVADGTGQAAGNEEGLTLSKLSRPSALRASSAFLEYRRPSLGLQRKSSIGPTSEQAPALCGSAVNSPVLGSDFVPTTPTRGSASIKWFEAAQLMTTPSPSSRRRSSIYRPEFFQTAVSNRGSRLRLSIGPMDIDASRQANESKALHFETRFSVQSTIGQGEFSQVDKVEDKLDGNLYAVKRMKKPYLGPRDRLRRLEEVDILHHLGQEGGHLNIITFIDAWEELGSLYIQTELCPCVDFSSFLQHNANMGGQLEEARLWKVFNELNEGLKYVHDMGVLHLDLKPANVFITEFAMLKIGDFGLATRWPVVDANTILRGAQMGDECNAESNALTKRKGSSLEREGDREYIAPEIIFDGRYSKAADVFSLGLILLEAAGNVILPDNGEPWQKLRNDDLSDVDLSSLSDSLIRAIQSCLQSDPNKRPTTEELQQLPVLQAVRKQVALGVQTSELDQLPVFDLPSGESSCSIVSQKSRGEETDTGNDIQMQDSESKRIATIARIPRVSVDDGAIPSKTGLGLKGVNEKQDDRDKVLDIRGALIHESIDFLYTILEAEPDPTARLFGMDSSFLAQQTFGRPVITIEDDAEGVIASSTGAKILQHVPFRASPLRQREEEDEEQDMDVDSVDA